MAGRLLGGRLEVGGNATVRTWRITSFTAQTPVVNSPYIADPGQKQVEAHAAAAAKLLLKTAPPCLKEWREARGGREMEERRTVALTTRAGWGGGLAEVLAGKVARSSRPSTRL